MSDFVDDVGQVGERDIRSVREMGPPSAGEPSRPATPGSVDAPVGGSRPGPSGWRKPATIAAGVVVVVLLLLTVAWAVDSVRNGTAVRRNVSVAGEDVGGLSQDDLLPVLRALDSTIGATPVSLVSPTKTLASTGADLGLRLDADATAAAALAVGRDDPLLARPFRWLGSFFGHDDAPVTLQVDSAKANDTIGRLEREVRTDPIEPSLTYRKPDLAVVPGKPGAGLDPTQVASSLAAITQVDGSPITVEVGAVPIPPRFTDEVALDLLSTASERTAGLVGVEIAGEDRAIAGAALRPLLRTQAEGDRLVLDLDPTGAATLLEETFADLTVAPGNGSLSISGGKVVVKAGTSGRVCCTAASVDALRTWLRDGVKPRLELAEVTSPKDTAYYAKLGVKEIVAEFTTNHPCCAPRVDNIHRIADLIQGALILPGETFSVNDFVGQRTRAKGFQAAPVINGDGNFDEDVGGGISQFATTLFNAAFFAGLDIPEYMAHGLYISRYPYGRESTISFPSPDVKIRNNTPYGVMLWPTYTDTSIRVAMYSTRYVVGEQTGQSEEKYDVACTQVTTTRTRTWLNTGETKTDRFYALYAAAEGVQCDGSTRPKPGETTTTTASTVPGATTTAPGATTPPTVSPGTTSAPTSVPATTAPATTAPAGTAPATTTVAKPAG